MVTINRNRIAKGIRISGRIIASLETAFFIVWLTAFTFFGANVSQMPFGPFKYVLSLFIVLLGFFLAWRRDLPAGVFLLMISAGTGAFVYHISYSFNAWLILGLPFVIAGVLFISSWLLSIKQGSLREESSH